MAPYFVAYKLANLIYSYEIDENDGVYDTWDYSSPFCYSYKITFANTRLKISINPIDLECVFEIKERDNYEAKMLFHRLYKKYRSREEADFSRYYDYGRDYNVLAYVGNHEILLQMLRDYFETVYK